MRAELGRLMSDDGLRLAYECVPIDRTGASSSLSSLPPR